MQKIIEERNQIVIEIASEEVRNGVRAVRDEIAPKRALLDRVQTLHQRLVDKEQVQCFGGLAARTAGDSSKERSRFGERFQPFCVQIEGQKRVLPDDLS